MNHFFQLVSNYQPAGGQPKAIQELLHSINANNRDQILLGVTGSGKTFVMAELIQKLNRPTLIMAHNKTLAAQLYGEMKAFFPHNAVEYFTSYFDYYQPEAYVPSSDTYIDKDSVVNSKLEQMKYSTMYSLLERPDTIVVASVSSIYGIGEKKNYEASKLDLKVNDNISISVLAKALVDLQYNRNDIEFDRSTFRIRGDILEIQPAHFEDKALRISFFGDEIEKIDLFDPLTGRKQVSLAYFRLYANSLFATPKDIIKQVISNVRAELYEQISFFKESNKLIEAQRIEERTNFDIEMLEATGSCKGIEHYSRYLRGMLPNEQPSTLFDYLPKNALLIVDESHVSLPQIQGMFKGDFSRKQNLVNYGFRLPSCLDNRPLKFEEWNTIRPQTIFVSATPSDFELKLTQGVVVEQLIRPTGLLDPICEIKPTSTQVEDLMQIAKEIIQKNQKILALTLTKKMAELLTTYLNEHSLKARYMHSDIDTMERIEIIRDLRIGKFDILVGINLLREGLDIPECSLVAILDADKEGFLRSKTSLIQTIGRAARNAQGRVILYADKETPSLRAALFETQRRREVQEQYNTKHNIIPTTVTSRIANIDELYNKAYTILKEKSKNDTKTYFSKKELITLKNKLEKQMHVATENLNFEEAIKIRDSLKQIEDELLEL